MSPELTQLIGTILAVMAGTGIVKWIIGRASERGVPKGDAARWLSFGVALLVTLAGIGLGYAELPAVACSIGDPSSCLTGITVWFGAAAGLANAAYMLIVERVQALAS